MHTSPATSAPVNPPSIAAASDPARPVDPARSSLARSVLGLGLLLGIGADALLRNGPVNLGLFVWISLVVAAGVAVTTRANRAIPGEARAWFGAALLFAIAQFLRSDGTLQAFDILAVMVSLALASITIARTPIAGIGSARVRDIVPAVASVFIDGFAGFAQLIVRDGALRSPFVARKQSAMRRGVRTAAMTIPVVLVFGALLRSADPVFASLVRLPDVDLGTILSHLAMIAFFCWISAGWARRAAIVDTPPADIDAYLSDAPSFGKAEITALLGAVNVLFALFVGVQIRSLFGGAAFLQQQVGLTVADYARGGFYQLLFVTLLVIPLLLVSRALATEDARTRHTKLGAPLVALVLAIMASAAGRMSLYVHYYGLTTDRFYALALMAWLCAVLGALSVTVLRDRPTRFVAISVIVGLELLAGLNVADPAAIVARTNLNRAAVAGAAAPAVDFSYLAGLSDGAAPLAMQALLRPNQTNIIDRCNAASGLLAIATPKTWQSWNADVARRAALVRKNRLALEAIARSCPKPKSQRPASKDPGAS